MTMTLITSEKNPTVKLAKALLSQSRQRKKHLKSVLEGTHLIEAALKNQVSIEAVLVAESACTHPEVSQLISTLQTHDCDCLTYVSDALYQSIRTLGTGLDIMAIITIPQPTLSPIHSDCLILDNVQDCGNVGTLLRTAAAVGIPTVLCSTHTAQVWSPKTLRAGMGAQFSLAIHEGLAVEQILQTVQIPLLATSSHTDNIIYNHNLSQPIAWVMGNEGQGVDDTLMQHATPIALPQPNGQESLNVAIAGALCLYETLRQRHYHHSA